MFSIRTIIWLCLIILLLPTDEAGKQALHKKAHAVADFARDICARVDLCSNFDPSWDKFALKAQTGRDLIADLISTSAKSEYRTRETNPAYREHSWQKPAAPENNSRSRNTLQIGDLLPEWKSPTQRNYAAR